jgi:hypothetical protein
MRSLLSMFLVSLVFSSSLFPRLCEEELETIPQLMAHFVEHRRSEALSFTEFLLLHYASEHGHIGHSQKGHPGLPLFHHTVSSGFCCVLPQFHFCFSRPAFDALLSLPHILYQQQYSYLFAAFLLQPPQ